MFALPNALTILRIILVPVFAIAYVLPGDAARIIAFTVFLIAGVSDWLDGFAARKLKAGSDFGRMLDPIADKVLVAVALMMLVAEGGISQFNLTTGLHSLLRLVPALIILAREILVSGLREFLAGTRVSVPVTTIAKFKTAVQMVAIGAMILTPLVAKDDNIPSLTYAAMAYTLLWIAAALTVYTGVIYFRNGMAHIRPGPSEFPQRAAAVTLLYFAWVRQKIGKSEETFPLPPSVANVGALITHLKSQGKGYEDAFADPSRIRVAVNQRYGGLDVPIREGDEIAFFPPVTGG